MPSITDIAGIRVGHATDLDGGTGCTVLLFDEPAMGGIDIGGGYASLRQADSLRPGGRVNEVHGFLLTGGSAFGMDAASGCMAALEEDGIGFLASVARIPTIPTAVLFDLGFGMSDRRPDAEMGRRACEAARGGPVQEGNVGAGTGCTVAKRLGYDLAWKGGLGSYSAKVGPWTVGALAAVNALGDIYDPYIGAPIAVARGPETGWRRPAAEAPVEGAPAKAGTSGLDGGNTTLVVVCTDAPFDRNQLCHLARMSHDGLARAIRPAHTPFDGDVVFTASTAPRDVMRADDLTLAEVGTVAIEVVAQAIVRGVRAARTLHGVPGLAGA